MSAGREREIKTGEGRKEGGEKERRGRKEGERKKERRGRKEGERKGEERRGRKEGGGGERNLQSNTTDRSCREDARIQIRQRC